MRTHCVIPDTQVKPGSPMDHLDWIGKYIVEYQPDTIIHLGDHADMESLSAYDKGRKAEGRRVKYDIEAARLAWDVLNKPIEQHNWKKRKNKEKQYKPDKHITLGNHEERIITHVDANPNLHHLLSISDLGLDRYDWQVHKFLDVVEVDGIHYSHYFANQLSGRPIGGTIDNRLKQIGFTFTMGHQQTKLVGSRYLANGERQRGLVCGTCYLYDDAYRKQANAAWHGIIIKHEVENGDYDLMEVSLDYLCRKYEQMRLHTFMDEKYGVLLERHRRLAA